MRREFEGLQTTDNVGGRLQKRLHIPRSARRSAFSEVPVCRDLGHTSSAFGRRALQAVSSGLASMAASMVTCRLVEEALDLRIPDRLIVL